jgi:hypothetical protein
VSNLTKVVLAMLVVMLVTGCGRFDRWAASITGSASHECVDGVEYLQFTSGASVAYKQDGSIRTCKG